MTASSLPVLLAYRRCLCRELAGERDKSARAMLSFALAEVDREIAERQRMAVA